MLDQTYNNKLISALLGRKLMPGRMPVSHRGRPMFSFWGEEAGMEPGDIHATRAYRIYVTYDDNLVITDADVVVDGELISPCSGYWPEALDEFDYPAILNWCIKHTEA